MAKYRLKKEYIGRTTVVLVNDIGYSVNPDFFNNYKNADSLIESIPMVGHFFEDVEGNPVNDAAKPVSKEPVPAKASTHKQKKAK